MNRVEPDQTAFTGTATAASITTNGDSMYQIIQITTANGDEVRIQIDYPSAEAAALDMIQIDAHSRLPVWYRVERMPVSA